MKSNFLIALCCVMIWSEPSRADTENEIRRGVFPFMAVVYYPDETVVDSTGVRFQRAAVLIKPTWLLSSAIDHGVVDNVPLGFPRKTLLAKAGAISIDANYTLNEDEDEQEREIIQLIRPAIHNVESWWSTDITLLQTLLPFKMTSSVGVATINDKKEYNYKNCVILVFAKNYGNLTEDRILMQLGVELLPPSIENCGTQFSNNTMTCGDDSDETKNSVNDPDFCQGNSGGPLICESEVVALQTYVDNVCKPPHLYQLLNAWTTFITCGVSDKCGTDEACNSLCVAVKKDTDMRSTITFTPLKFEPSDSAESSESPRSPESPETPETTTTTPLEEKRSDDNEPPPKPIISLEEPPPVVLVNNDMDQKEESNETTTLTERTSSATRTTTKPTVRHSASSHNTEATTPCTTKPWPMEKIGEQEYKKMEQAADLARTSKVEPQMQQMKISAEPMRPHQSLSQLAGKAHQIHSMQAVIYIVLSLANFV